ncbi:pyrroline-5-carboxylate reductase [Neisseriaceae bacterium ESL0693]|nr:pyrroline-5-carboxylate reductase [Neisseriaceae bacterium ESL0693]
MSKIGFIGAGNMATAMIKGIIGSGQVKPADIVVFDSSKPKAYALRDQLGIESAISHHDVTSQAEVIILAVKPDVVLSVLKQDSAHLRKEQVVVSIAAGVSLAQLMQAAPENTKLVRVMPNTPALVGAGMSALTANDQVTAEEQAQIQALFESFGQVVWLPEAKMHAVTGVSGSGPAYGFMFIEALADAGVVGGLTRQQSLQLAAQTLMGAAKMVLETGEHPAILKDNVCSPGGTTIEAVKTLEDQKFRSAIINAALAAMEKSKALI